MDHAFRVKLLGVRGTLPVSGDAFTRFGGGTSCVLVEAGETCILLDAGTGLLTPEAAACYGKKRLTLLISHAHADHLLGFLMFPPLFQKDCRCDVYMKTRAGLDARQQIERLMTPPLWPIDTTGLKAQMQFHDVAETFFIDGVRVDTMESRHPGGSTIYKLSYGEASLVYATDYEPENDAPDAFCAFAGGCSLLLLDGQYTEEEYEACRGFGHSTIGRSAAIARSCGAACTRLVHHDPKRTDAQLLAMEAHLQAENARIRFGRGGEEVVL